MGYGDGGYGVLAFGGTADDTQTMTDTLVSDGYPLVLDEGIGSVATSDDRWVSAGVLSASTRALGEGGYVDDGLEFTGHDATNDHVDVTAGAAFVTVPAGVDVQATLGGQSAPTYDTVLPQPVPVGVVLPTNVVDLAVTGGVLNDFWVVLDTDGTGPGSAGTVYVRHGSGLSAPSHPSVQIGKADPDDSTRDVLENRGPDLVVDTLTVNNTLTPLADVGPATEERNVEALADAFSSDGVFAGARFAPTSATHGQTEPAFRGAVLTPRNRIVFPAYDSSNLGIFDARSETFVAGPAHGDGTGTGAYWGGTLATTGQVLLAPHNASSADRYNPYSETFATGPTHGEGGGAFADAVLAPDGRVILVPWGSSNVGIVSSDLASYTSGAAHSQGANAYSGASLMADGRIVLAPFDADAVGIFDPSDNTFTAGPTHGQGGDAYQGSVLLPDGRVAFVPFTASTVGLFDPTDDTFTAGPEHGEGVASFSGGTIAPDGRAIFAPNDASVVGIFDPDDDSFTSTQTHGRPAGAFRGAALTPDGRVVLAPSNADAPGVADVFAQTPNDRGTALHPLVSS